MINILYDVDWIYEMNVAWNIVVADDYVRLYPIHVEHVCAYLVHLMTLDKLDIEDFEDRMLMIDIDFLGKKEIVRHM